MATLVLTVVGGIVGGPVGAAIGAAVGQQVDAQIFKPKGREGPRLADLKIQARSEEHTSELQSLMRISYAVFCLKKKKTTEQRTIKLDRYNHNHTQDLHYADKYDNYKR